MQQNPSDETLQHELEAFTRNTLQYAKSLEVIRLLGDLNAALIGSEELSHAILERMEGQLWEVRSVEEYFYCAQTAEKLGREDFQVKFISMGLELAVQKGGVVCEYPEELELMRELMPQNARLRKLIETSVEKRIAGLKQHGNGIVVFVSGDDWIAETASMISMVYEDWKDAEYYINKTMLLLEVEGLGEEERDSLIHGLITCLRNELNVSSYDRLVSILKQIDGKTVFSDEYEDSFKHLLKDYKKKVKALTKE